MPVETNMELVRRWVDQVWNRGDLDRIADFHPPTFRSEGRDTTPGETKLWHIHNRSTFPDIHYRIDDMFAAEDRVALRWSATATHLGALWELIPATGKRIHWNGMHLLRLADNKIVEVWALQNNLAQLRQLGATLQPPADDPAAAPAVPRSRPQ